MFHYNFNKSVFYGRIQRFYAAWKDESDKDFKLRFPEMDAFVCSASRKEGRFSHFRFYLTLKDNMSYCKSSTFQRWLFGYEFTDTIIVLTKKAVLIFTHERNVSIFKQLEDDEVKINTPAVKFFFRKEEDDSENYLKKIISEIKDSGEGKKIGIFTDDKFHGPFMKEWEIILKEANFEMVDIGAAFGLLISSKEEIEIETIKKCSDKISKKYKDYGLMEVTDSEKKVLQDQSLHKSAKNISINNRYLLGADYYIYSPMSCKFGWYYGMKSNVIRRKNLRPPDTMIFSVKARSQSYFSTFTRTILVEPTNSIKENYQFLLEIEGEVIKNLKAGAKLCDVYQAGFELIRNKKPHLIGNVKDNFGFAMGIELREPSVAISPESTVTLRENMVFNVEVGFSNLSNEDASSKENELYSLFIGNAVLVNGNGPATILTSYSNKVEDLTVFLKEESEEKIEENLIVEISPMEKEAKRKRKEHQKILSAQLHTSLKLRLLQKSTQNSNEKDEETEKEKSAEHNALILSTNGKNPKLTDFLIKPNIHPESLAGVLEAHENGFRYTSARGDKVDILFSNIKNAFYQSCCEEMIVLLHFHLKHAIMVAEEKHIDVQFYMKIADLENRGSHGLAAGETEKELMGNKKIQLEMFCKEVENMADIKFDTPDEELVIRGISGEVLLQSTRDGLVSLIKWPVFIINLKDIELVHLTKVHYADSDNFDMMMFFKNYLKEPAIIKDIPKKMLDNVEEWLDSHDIKYSERGLVINLNWANYLKKILEKLDDYVESGGWGRHDEDSEVEEDDEDEDEN